MDALLQRWFAEIYQQAHRKLQQAQIGQHLLAVDGGDLFDRFQFDDDLFFNKQIDAASISEMHVLIVK